MSHMSELAECREAFRSQPEGDWLRALQGGPVAAVEETPSLEEMGKRPGKAERDYRYYEDEAEVLARDRLRHYRERAYAQPEILSLDVELDEPEIANIPVALEEPDILDLSNDPLIMGILAGDIRTLCLDCSERDCPAHPVNGIV